MFNRSLVAQLIRKPESAQSFTKGDWDLLLQQAYSAGVLARLYWLLERSNLISQVPQQLQWHFQSAWCFAQTHQKGVLREVQYICQALKMSGVAPVFLKGAAYILCQDDSYHGRVFSDVDIFVPKEALANIEQLLGWHGWQFAEKDEYDDKYYRQWMHELPPMIHAERGTALDVHHNLLPLIGRIKLNADLLHQGAQRISNDYKVLAVHDRVLHSAAHLLLNGEFEHGFRDISDIYLLIIQHQSTDFWSQLSQRAIELGLNRILLYCLDVLIDQFALSVPAEVLANLSQSPNSPNARLRNLMKFLHTRALQPAHPSCTDSWSDWAVFILFLRSHWMKMPVSTLLLHLTRKAWIKPLLDWYKSRHQANA